MRSPIATAVHCFEVAHEAWKILEVTPEAVEFLRGFIDGDGPCNLDELYGSAVASGANTQRLIELAIARHAAVQHPTA
jgi:hypothetical protein